MEVVALADAVVHPVDKSETGALELGEELVPPDPSNAGIAGRRPALPGVSHPHVPGLRTRAQQDIGADRKFYFMEADMSIMTRFPGSIRDI